MIFDENDTSTETLYQKYMAFNRIMLEDYEAIELASIMVVQGLSFFRTALSEEEFQRMMKTIYDKRDLVKTLE